MVDFRVAEALNGVMTPRRLASLAIALFACGSAQAMVGGAPPAGDLGRAVVMLVGSKGTSCSGVALARDLVLTAGHCVMPGADYKLVEFDAARSPQLRDIARIALHPGFDAEAAARSRVTADVALVKLAVPLQVTTLPLDMSDRRASPGDRFVVVGNGLAVPGDGKSGGTPRRADLVATGQPGTLQIRLTDPRTMNKAAGLGACTADSGAPALRERDGRLVVAGVVSWSTGPNNTAGCGGLTGVTPLIRYRGWIVETAGKLGAALR